MLHKRRWIAVLCIAVVVLTAVTPAASFLLCGVLVLVWPLFGMVVAGRIRRPDGRAPEPFPFLQPLASRAPPVA